MLSLEAVASILNWTETETEMEWDALSRGFMTPEVQWFTVDPELENDITTNHGHETAGFYCRLSASGYLDCTDWSGPFQTENEAVAELISMYGME